ncbi:hypothetical protein HZA44_00125 [Candidatus Peregrinibacteria bacterium]|nr:hypothetical protein [Candidatus Peregrinibacteria bacterium]
MSSKMLRISATLLTLVSAWTPSALAATSTTTLSIGNDAPSFTAGPSDNGSDGTTPTNAGSNVTFTATATDPNGDQWYLAVCKTNAITPGSNAAPTCASVPNTWAISGATNSASQASITYATSAGDAESNDWYAFTCDKVVGTGSCSAMAQGAGSNGSPFKVNHRPVIGTVTAGSSYGSNASVDPGSGAGSPIKVTTDFNSGNDYGRGLLVDANGKYLVFGTAAMANSDFAVARYNSDGTLDTSFDTDGKVSTDVITATHDHAYAAALQADGKIVVAGTSDSTLTFNMIRYNTDGSLDTTFDTDGKVSTNFTGGSETPYAVAIQTDGKIILAGQAHNGVDYDFALARYNTNGSLDTTFDTDGLVTTGFGSQDYCYDIALQTDGKIVAVGTMGSAQAVIRYNTDGSLDTTFDGDVTMPGYPGNGKVSTVIGSGSGGNNTAYAVVLQPDGKIVTAGDGYNLNWDFSVARYNTDGTLDTTFDTDGKLTTAIGAGSVQDHAYDMALQSDGKIVLAGQAHNGANYDFALARYSATGALDTTFDTDGKLITTFGTNDETAYGVAALSSGKIVAAGDAFLTNSDFALIRYTSTGAVDTSAGSGSIYVRTGVTDTDTDTSPDTISLYVCSTNDFTGGTCAATTLCSTTGVASGANADCTITGTVPVPTAHGSYAIYVFLKDSHGFADAGTANTQSYSVTDTAPYISDSNAYSVTNITLTADSSTAKSYTVTVKDDNGDNDIVSVTGVLFDDTAVNLASGTCSSDENDCFPGVSCSLSNNASGTDNSATATCAFTVWFNANYSSNWRLHANLADGTSTVTSSTDSAAIATNAVQAINVPEAAIAYGTIALGNVSSGITITLQNVGNQTLDLLVEGTDMGRTGGGGTIAAGQQKWHNTIQDFTYASAGNTLVTSSAGATTKAAGCADRDITVRNAHISGSGSDESLYFKLQIPSSQTAGSYTGTNTLASTSASTCSDGE